MNFKIFHLNNVVVRDLVRNVPNVTVVFLGWNVVKILNIIVEIIVKNIVVNRTFEVLVVFENWFVHF